MTMTNADLMTTSMAGAAGEPDPGARAKRRTFTAAYKAQVLAEYEALPAGGSERGSLLRREGLYSSHLTEWRRARDAGGLAGLGRRRKAGRSPEQVELEKLRRCNARLEAELAKTKLALEIAGKVHALWEILSESADSNTRSKP